MAAVEAVLIAGPTASGKSRLAMELAGRLDGVIVNADSMQVYDGLSILTARPSAADMATLPHALYGHVRPGDPYSAGTYLRDAAASLAAAKAAGRLPIFCGGTGLYFKALLGLLDEMPPVPAAIREHWRGQLAAEGAPALHRLLAERDPVAASRIALADGQRIVRALEVGEASGRTLSALQAGRGEGPLEGARTVRVVLAPDRSELRERIARRFDAMLADGALAEVEAFRRMPGALDGSAARAIGVDELGAVIDGTLDLAAARERAITRTRQYAKRQETWFRHQFGPDWQRLDAPDPTRIEGI
ncbi:tRNA (adenosine(37)-N6)-dimethylallyltransferase MiaA [Aurantimonas sp. HBX-1]|uniref:tRNA (adenosine(37)-N6)-dimethylallyltransferase MiaA n=1 Tax=Aurantimonas sp. HBX-1 TaxID=2906072 RepID=UPI001F030848|nr:tRNA (adenosine(37)-N6)-dimethylallyltransferase MiaA [Aurantimonas sp. HBX-1]UIJ70509.1 tRNA (adenosine(37)-N6)-dimethylallyltransferase MiaA [Aurantimonas sp. HBX-1]